MGLTFINRVSDYGNETQIEVRVNGKTLTGTGKTAKEAYFNLVPILKEEHEYLKSAVRRFEAALKKLEDCKP